MTKIEANEIAKTERLVLRHFKQGDAARVRELANNWNVARMLSRMPYPYSDDDAQAWLASHEKLRVSGHEYPLAIEHDGELIGATSVTTGKSGQHEIGIWIGEPYWNRGYGTEAARAAILYGFEHLGSADIVASHFATNHASGRMLTKLGFRYTREQEGWCEARREKMRALAMRLPSRHALRQNAGASKDRATS